MKVEQKAAEVRAGKTVPGEFRRILQQALLAASSKEKKDKVLVALPLRPVSARALLAVASTTRSALAGIERLGSARVEMHQECDRLELSAGQTRVQRREAEQERSSALQLREDRRQETLPERARLTPSPPLKANSPEPLEAGAPQNPQVPGTSSADSTRSPGTETDTPPVALASALELVERIETFVREQRPGLALTLKGALEGELEIERTGHNEVAVLLKTRTGQLPLHQMAEVRDALRARGLKVRQLRVA